MNTLSMFRINKILVAFILVALLLGTALPTQAQQGIGQPDPNAPLATKIYLPLVIRPAVSPDLYISNIEVTQAIQKTDNSVPMVADRTTVVRVFVRTANPSALTNMTVQLAETRGSSTVGTPLILSAKSAYPTSVTYTTMRSSATYTFNFTLPANWTTSGAATLTATVDPYQILWEDNKTNNSLGASVSFNTVAALNVMVVPVRYTHLGTYYYGYVYPPAPYAYLHDYMYQLYPVPAVNLIGHSSINFSGDLEGYDAWDALLTKVDNLKAAETTIPESYVYYGLIPMVDSSGKNPWWGSSTGGGVLGLGWVGYRSAIGTTSANISGYQVDGANTAAHEIGHNLNREHAPCGGPGSVDPSYPYTNAKIGNYGFNPSTMQVVADTIKDIMSYCEPAWVSDYTYVGMYNDQRVNGLAPQMGAQASVFVRARFSADGTPQLDPVYSFEGVPSTQSTKSDYSVEFIDLDGQVIASYPVAVKVAQGQTHQLRYISSVLPQPTSPYASVRLVQAGQIVASRAITAGAQSVPAAAPAVVKTDSGFMLRWGASGSPAALVRYTVDGGLSWNVLDLDVTGGQMIFDPQELPTGPLHFEICLADGSGTLSLDY